MAPDALGALQKPDPLAAAWLRGLLARAQLLESEGGPLTVDQVARLLGISRQAVEKRRCGGKLLGLDTGKRGYLYPQRPNYAAEPLTSDPRSSPRNDQVRILDLARSDGPEPGDE